MFTYYNEWDAPMAAWLRELGAGHHLPSGHVDTRSIRDVCAEDLRGFDQCHFFAGIGGWSLALRWAGLEDVPGIWTGSPPCQPFSVAGKGLAQSDDRHLAPVWLDLIKECRPPIIFGEQVADAIGKWWLDDLFDALEREGYACGAAVLPACSVGAPHLRKRLFFGAVRLADPDRSRLEGLRTDVDPQGRQGSDLRSVRLPSDLRNRSRPAHPYHGGWESADWLGCRDSKFRPVEPGTQPLAHGLPARVGRLRGYGNAIVPQVAATFITEFLGAFADAQLNAGAGDRE